MPATARGSASVNPGNRTGVVYARNQAIEVEKKRKRDAEQKALAELASAKGRGGKGSPAEQVAEVQAELGDGATAYFDPDANDVVVSYV